MPVALVDSYKPFGLNSLRKVRTQVHFLAPIYYEEYAGMKTSEIAELVKSRIASVMDRQIRLKKRA